MIYVGAFIILKKLFFLINENDMNHFLFYYGI